MNCRHRCAAAALLSALLASSLYADDDAATANTFLDIEWQSQQVDLLMGSAVGSCQVADTFAAAPDENSTRKAPITLLRHLYYLANDYHGLGVNHYILLRSDVGWSPGIPANDTGTAATLAPDAVSLVPKPQVTDHSVFGDAVFIRHTVVDPFDQSVLSDTVYRYVIEPVDTAQYALGTAVDAATQYTNFAGLHFMQRVSYPAAVPHCKDGGSSCGMTKADYSHYDLVYRQEKNHNFLLITQPELRMRMAEQMPMTLAADPALDCLQWQMEQTRMRNGKQTAQDRQLEAIQKQHALLDRLNGGWIIADAGL